MTTPGSRCGSRRCPRRPARPPGRRSARPAQLWGVPLGSAQRQRAELLRKPTRLRGLLRDRAPRHRRGGQDQPALPPPDLRQGGTVPTDPQEVVAPPAPRPPTSPSCRHSSTPSSTTTTTTAPTAPSADAPPSKHGRRHRRRSTSASPCPAPPSADRRRRGPPRSRSTSAATKWLWAVEWHGCTRTCPPRRQPRGGVHRPRLVRAVTTRPHPPLPALRTPPWRHPQPAPTLTVRDVPTQLSDIVATLWSEGRRPPRTESGPKAAQERTGDDGRRVLARHEVMHPDGRQFLLYGDVDDGHAGGARRPTGRLGPRPVAAAPSLRPTHRRLDPRVAGPQRATEHDDHGRGRPTVPAVPGRPGAARAVRAGRVREPLSVDVAARPRAGHSWAPPRPGRRRPGAGALVARAAASSSSTPPSTSSTSPTCRCNSSPTSSPCGGSGPRRCGPRVTTT